MIIPTGQVIRIASFNMERCYIAFQNLNTAAADKIYILQQEAEPEVFLAHGIVIGALGMFEMQNCLNPKSKMAWFAYCKVAAGADIRVMDI